MAMNLARVTQSSIEKAARDSGLVLTADQVREIAETESACLAECRRVSFGESAAIRVVHAFASSSFVTGETAAGVLAKLTESFYELRDDLPAVVTDAEIFESLQESFEGEAAGDVGLAAALTGEQLSKQLDYLTYEVVDDDGKVYRWDPEEWHDDAMADGWCGEQWEDADE